MVVKKTPSAELIGGPLKGWEDATTMLLRLMMLISKGFR